MGLLMGQKLVKSGSTWARLCRTHISETVGWIYTIWNSMELSKPVVVQHHGHLNLTLDFQGKSLKMLYLRNGWADWHGTKGMWVDRMLDPHCDLEQWPHPWPWPLVFKFWHQILKWFFPGMGGPRCPLSPKRPINLISLSRNGRTDRHWTKGIWADRVLYLLCDLQLWPWLDLGFSRLINFKNAVSGMGGPIDIEPKGCESIGC